MSITIKRAKSTWGFWSFDDSFNHSSIEVPQDCYIWQDDLSHSLQGCLEGVCKDFNRFADSAWEQIKSAEDIGVEEMDPYECRANDIANMRIKV